MRKLNLTIQFEDNDLTEHKVRSYLESYLGDSIISMKTLPNTDEFKNDKVFRTLIKFKNNAQKSINEYIDKKRNATH